MVDLDKLKAELEKARQESEAQVANQTEAFKIKAELAVLTNPEIQNAKVAAEVDKINTEKLDGIIQQAKVVVNSMPVMDERKRQNREFKPGRFFGLGAQIDKVYQVLSGILYSSDKHKPQLLAFTKLDINLIETTIEAFGEPESYYNGNTRPEVLPNTAKLRANLALVSSKLGITLDLSAVTKSRMDSIFASAKSRAAQDKASHEVTLAQESQVIDLN